MSDTKRRIILVIVVALVVGAIVILDSQRLNQGGDTEVIEVPTLSTAEKDTLYPKAKEITTPDGFINTDDQPITISELIGKKVILIDFWTYSCINCQRTFPFLNSWYEKYRDQGLEIIGIHTPEFAFEQEYANVLDATERFDIEFPVVLDNDYSTWRAYENRYWPRKYIIDIDGYIVYDHIGEGAYEETEGVIKSLLAERAERLGEDVDLSARVTEEGERGSFVTKSPETYFGAWRNDNFGNGPVRTQLSDTFELPDMFMPSVFYLGGEWQIRDEHIESRGDSMLVFRYQAQEVNFVAGAEKGVVVEITVDGSYVTPENAGHDIEFQGEKSILRIQREGLYNLIDAESNHVCLLEIRVLTPSLEDFTFTFG